MNTQNYYKDIHKNAISLSIYDWYDGPLHYVYRADAGLYVGFALSYPIDAIFKVKYDIVEKYELGQISFPDVVRQCDEFYCVDYAREHAEKLNDKEEWIINHLNKNHSIYFINEENFFQPVDRKKYEN